MRIIIEIDNDDSDGVRVAPAQVSAASPAPPAATVDGAASTAAVQVSGAINAGAAPVRGGGQAGSGSSGMPEGDPGPTNPVAISAGAAPGVN
ncbi:hypothetical protein [Variovorax sp. J22R115]|uniref:hypothetical protein n=1 Tax=Variovorax sp. J22R115 TaxID=3053509 RepID=UPI0025763D32|nr:hypothetical protein [Variovorax sp. J22R115]MDM0053805.1 hypothetical protein [Variovorax sp. J22R115]